MASILADDETIRKELGKFPDSCHCPTKENSGPEVQSLDYKVTPFPEATFVVERGTPTGLLASVVCWSDSSNPRVVDDVKMG